MTHRGKCGGFSLTELLVTLGVVASLAGLILPGLSKARLAAGGARCTSNLRQLVLASQLYWDDHAGTTFAERRGRQDDGWLYWFGWLQDGVEGERRFDATAGALWPYLRGRGVEVCPALDRHSERFKAKARGAAYGYGYNILLGPRGGEAVRMHQLMNPSGLAVYVDSGQINDFQPPASQDRPMLEEFYYFGTNRLEATVHFRHAQRAVAAFADGHVSTELPEPGSVDPRLPPHLIGRLDATRVRP